MGDGGLVVGLVVIFLSGAVCGQAVRVWWQHRRRQ